MTDTKAPDPAHNDGSLVRAAACYLEAAQIAANAEYALAQVVRYCERNGIDHLNDEDINRQREHPVRHHYGWDKAPGSWPWGLEEWEPSTDPVPNLKKAGAFIAAEIDRRLRALPPDASEVDHD